MLHLLLGNCWQLSFIIHTHFRSWEWMNTQIKSGAADEKGFESGLELWHQKLKHFFLCHVTSLRFGTLVRMTQMAHWQSACLSCGRPWVFSPRWKEDLMWAGESWKTEYDITNSLKIPPQDQPFLGNLTQEGKKHSERGFQWRHPHSLSMSLSCPFFIINDYCWDRSLIPLGTQAVLGIE